MVACWERELSFWVLTFRRCGRGCAAYVQDGIGSVEVFAIRMKIFDQHNLIT